MLCPKCGKQIAEDADVCPCCGATIQLVVPTPLNAQVQGPARVIPAHPESAQEGEERESGMNRLTRDIGRKSKFVATIATVCVALVLALVKFSAVSSHMSFDSQDGAAFLHNAAYLAGLRSSPAFLILDGYPPGFPFLLSILLRVNGQIVNDGWALSVALFFTAMMACFWISRRVMNPYFALLASISFGISPQVYEWAGMIITNVEGVALAAASFALLVYATRANRWWYLVAFPLMALATLTRFTMATIFVPVIVYLVLERGRVKQRLRFVMGGLVALAIVAAVISYQWVAAALSQNEIGQLLPAPLTGQESLGVSYYAVHFAANLAPGAYGLISSGLLICSMAYIVGQSLRRRYSDVDPAIYALLAWFVTLFLYYSLVWPSPTLRYSLDFVMPVFVLGYWFLSKAVGFLSSHVAFGTNGLKSVLALLLIVTAIVGTVYPAFSSADYVVTTPPYSYQVSFGQLNTGVSQASYWLQQNVNTDVRIAASGGGWLFQSLAPQFNVDPFYPGNNCNSLKLELSRDGDGYLVIISGIYVGDDSGCPFSSIQVNATFWHMIGITPVHVVATAQGNITIFKVI